MLALAIITLFGGYLFIWSGIHSSNPLDAFRGILIK